MQRLIWGKNHIKNLLVYVNFYGHFIMPLLFMYGGHWKIVTLVGDEFGILWPCALIMLVWLPSEIFVEKPSQRQITFVGLNVYQTQYASDYLNLIELELSP